MGTREHLTVREACFYRALLIIGILFGVSVASVPTPVNAQAPRVQFIHASPYAEVSTIDVYRNGVLWLDDFKFAEARPLEDWPSTPDTHLAFTFGGAPDAADPFFEQTLHLSLGETYFVIAGGDPLRRANQPAFAVHIDSGVLDVSPFGSFVAVQSISLVPDAPRFGKYWRRVDENQGGRFNGRLTTVYPDTYSYGQYQGYIQAPSVQFEGDVRAELGDVVEPPYPLSLVDAWLRSVYVEPSVPVDPGAVFDAVVLNFADKDYGAFIIVDTGFIHPPIAGDAPLTNIMVMPDGTIEYGRSNTARVQWVNNSPYVEAELVDVYVNGVRIVDDLAFREATPFLELPAGMLDATAPPLTIGITPSDASGVEEAFNTGDVRLIFGGRYVFVIQGDPMGRLGQPPPELSKVDGVDMQKGVSGSTSLVFLHGAPDVPAVSVGFAGEPRANWRTVAFRNYTSYGSIPVVDDTLFVARAADRSIMASFVADFSSRNWADSSIVLLTSGFDSRPKGIAGVESDLELVAVLSGGGRLALLEKEGPPGWWTNPWIYVLGLLGLSFLMLVGNWARIRRLRARERELSALVEERTHELQEEKKKTEEQAARLVELDEAKNRFFANISHEFRTPLTLILGPVQDAIDGRLGPVGDGLRKQLFVMRRSSRRLLRLVNQLLDLSRLESGDLKLNTTSGDLAAFAEALTRSFVPAAERDRINLTFESDVEDLRTYFDPDAMEKILTNLISNALKFTPADGSVAVRLREIDNTTVEIDVADSGPGIAPEDRERIFERFQQSDTSIRRRYEGSGIGLSLAKELSELHGGHLRLESEPGEGSTFTVRLPIQTVESAGGPKGQPPGTESADVHEQERELIDTKPLDTLVGAFSGDGAENPAATVLIVEDNADVRAFIRGHLEKDWEIVEANDGEAGLKAALEYEPDLVISDVMMPNMDGYEMCRLIRANETVRNIPIIMLTAKATEADTLEGLESGADDYITKPFSMPELEAKIAHIIESRQELRERFSREIVVKPGDVTITPEEEVFLDQVLDVVNQHLGDGNFTTEWLADEVGLSRRQLDRRVQAVFGETPSELIRRLRLERASQLLRAHAGTVSEVAYAVGYRSPAHFSRVFRQAYGVAPSEVSDWENEPDSLAR